MKRIVSLLSLVAIALISTAAFAEEGAATTYSAASSLAWAAAIVMGLGSAVGTFSQSRAAATALEGIARNPQAADKMGTPLILSLALMESLVILAFVIAFFLQGKIA